MFYSNVVEHIFDVGNPESEWYFVGGIPKLNFWSRPIPSIELVTGFLISIPPVQNQCDFGPSQSEFSIDSIEWAC